MKRFVLSLGLMLTVAPLPMALAQPAQPTTGPSTADAGEQKKRLIEQKIRLLETLLGSPAAKNPSPENAAEVGALVTESRQVIERARKEAADARFDDAGKLLDDAMKAIGKVTRKKADAGFADSAQRKTYADQSEQIATYRKSVVDLTRHPQAGAGARSLLEKIDLLTGEAKQLAAADRLGEANRKLADAYKLVTEDIARLRQGHEVVMSLKFDTPAEEFSYEEKRFGSNRIMADMLISEGKADGDKRKLIDPFLSEAGRLQREAETLARAGSHKEAVKAMEKANGQLVKALQMMGVPVF